MATVARDPGPLREQMLAAGRYLIDYGGVSPSRHGNMSVRLAGTDLILLTTPSLDGFGVDDLPLLDLEGRLVEGHIDPNAREIIHMHTAVYRKRPDVGSVVHTHAIYATAFAVASRPINCVYEGLARRGVVDPVPVARYGPRGSEQAVRNIVDVLGESTKAVLLENHGILAFDRSVQEAAGVVIALEEAAMLSLFATALGGPKLIPREMANASIKRAADFQQQGTLQA